MNVFAWVLCLFLLTLAGLLFAGEMSAFLLAGIIGGLVAALCIAGFTSMFFQPEG